MCIRDRVVLPNLLILAATVGAWVFSLSQVLSGGLSFTAVAINIGWSFFNISGIIIALRAALQKPIFRKTERLQLAVPKDVRIRCGGRYVAGEMKDISGQGCRISLSKNLHIRLGRRLHILLDHVKICLLYTSRCV